VPGWYERLSADDKELVLTLADVIGSAYKDTAERIAASLPPAPKLSPLAHANCGDQFLCLSAAKA
jgi:hypothetical protein